MRLEFRQRYLSITALPAIDLPKLTIILGLNGSGKTHLLESIVNGSVWNSQTDINVSQSPVPAQSNNTIRLLSNQPNSAGGMSQSTPIVQNTYQPRGGQISPQGRAMQFEQARQQILAQFAPRLEAALGVELNTLTQSQDAWRLGEEELVRRASDTANAEAVKGIFVEAEQAMLASPSRVPPHPQLSIALNEMSSLKGVISKLGLPALSVTGKQMDALQPWSTDQFQADLATLFGRYRDAMLKNKLARLQDESEGTSTALSETRFIEVYGPPPWQQVSDLFQTFRLPYVAATPPLLEYTPVSFSLLRQDTGDAVAPANLSAGEKILLQFAISSIQYDEDLTRITRPRLLLLDEMDAPLHPEMVHHWLQAVQSGVVEDQGIHCILTTHSPTTVALAPEEALYEMRDGSSGLRKVSKQEALNRLTFGLPTLSIDYSGRRQVFTESDTDAAIYERVYSLIKSQIECPRELNFLSTGMRNKDGGEINSGCTVVKNIVDRLNDTGNLSVFGIIDWDGESVSTDRVRVIAEGSHDGIENLLLDPLLVCLLLLKGRRTPEGLDDIDRFSGVENLEQVNLQRLADAVQTRVLPDCRGDVTTVTYLGGATLSVLVEYATMDDHELEDALRTTFPYLRKWSSRGALVTAVVDEVLTEYRQLCPKPIGTLFEEVASF